MSADRICFTLQVRPDRLDEYRRRHEQVWPEMLAALRDTGWRDYWLFLRDDGLLVGTLVAEDFAAVRAAMERTDVNARWQEEMASFFVDLDDRRPDEGMRTLDEVFHLETALAHAGLPTAGPPAAGTPTAGPPAAGTPTAGTPTAGPPTEGSAS